MLYTIVDIETTGFLEYVKSGFGGRKMLSDNSEILEVGFIVIESDNYSIVNYGTLYFYKDYFNLENKSAEYHKLTREFLSKYKDKFDMNLIALASLMESTYIIGKNSKAFDIPFIRDFLYKHSGNILNFEYQFNMAELKDEYNRKLTYIKRTESFDLQYEYKERYFKNYDKKYSMYVGKGIDDESVVKILKEYVKLDETSEHYKNIISTHKNNKEAFVYTKVYPYPDKPKLSNRAYGQLEDYIDVITNGKEMVDSVYASLDKERVTGAHGALYDCVMTYIAYLDYVFWKEGN